MSQLEIKAFIVPFYRQYLGFWVLIVVFTTVFMEWKQHLLLAELIFRLPLLHWALPAIFSFYSWMVLQYQKELLRIPTYQLFQSIGLWEQSECRTLISSVWLSNHLPILIYLLFLSVMGIIYGSFAPIIFLWIMVVGSLVFQIGQIEKALRLPIPERVLNRPLKRFSLPESVWFVLHLRNHRPLLLLATKALGLIFLGGFFSSFQTGRYDLRWLLFSLLVVAFLQVPILMERLKFEREKLYWFKSLPSGLAQKLGKHFISLSIFIFPELLMIFWRSVEQPGWQLGLVLLLFFISLCLGLLAQLKLIQKNGWSEKKLFLSFFGLFLFILFSVSPNLISILLFSAIIWILRDPLEA